MTPFRPGKGAASPGTPLRLAPAEHTHVGASFRHTTPDGPRPKVYPRLNAVLGRTRAQPRRKSKKFKNRQKREKWSKNEKRPVMTVVLTRRDRFATAGSPTPDRHFSHTTTSPHSRIGVRGEATLSDFWPIAETLSHRKLAARGQTASRT